VCGSSDGLGFATAELLAAEGCRVALNGRVDERLERARRALAGAHQDRVAAFRADVSDPAQAEDLVRSVQRHFGSLDVLVCNAGGPPATQFASAPPQAWQAGLDLNLLSTIHLCRAAVPIMRERGWGRIVCITSVAAKQPMPGLILSTTSRAGVHGFVKSLSDELAPHGITVNNVCPGYTRTGRVESLAAQRAAQTGRSGADIEAQFVKDVPMARMGEPAEFAAAVAFLTSECASYITGVSLQVDGGFTRSIV